MRRVTVAALLALFAAMLAPHVASAVTFPDPDIHYDFEGDLIAEAGTATLTPEPSCSDNTRTYTPCNSVTGFGSDSSGGYWEWTSTTARGGGFTLSTPTSIGTSYTIALRFSFSQVSGYRKIIDYLNRASDTGFYVYGSRVNFYPLGTGTTTFSANQVLDLVAVRESTGGATGNFKVYLNTNGSLTQLLSVTDSLGTSIPFVNGSGNTILGFFYDDNATSGEGTPSGKVWDLKIWNGQALTESQVTNVTSASQVAGAPTLTSPPVLSGSDALGGVLQVSDGTWTGTGNTYTYQWYACTAAVNTEVLAVPGTCSAIAGATNNSYTVTGTENHIIAVVTATNASGAALSTTTSRLAGTIAPPSLTANPQLSGNVAAGSTVQTSDGTWTGTGLTFSYAWYDCAAPVAAGQTTAPAGCNVIANETTSSYQLTGNEQNVVAFVTATNGGGQLSASSASVVPVLTPPAPTPYLGPVAQGFSSKVLSQCMAQAVTITGLRLGGITAEIQGRPVTVLENTDSKVVLAFPAGLEPSEGVDLVFRSASGKLTIQDAFSVSGDVCAQENQRSVWTQLQSDGKTVKMYAKDPIGDGKIQFFVDGKELAWINAIDEADPKLSFASTNPYLVRSVELKPGKNRFEIKLDGVRVWRATYVPKG